MTVSKRVAKSGAVTLPRQLRQETGILPGVPVDIEADADGYIFVSMFLPVTSAEQWTMLKRSAALRSAADVQKRSWRSLKDNGCGGSKKEG